MVELVDTQRSERCGRKVVEVQVLFRPPNFRKVIGLESRRRDWRRGGVDEFASRRISVTKSSFAHQALHLN